MSKPNEPEVEVKVDARIRLTESPDCSAWDYRVAVSKSTYKDTILVSHEQVNCNGRVV